MFVAETENYVRDYDSRLRQNGLDLATYFKYTGLTLEALREQMRPQAEKQVKIRLALEKIAELESLTVSPEELEAEYKRISEAYSVELEEVKKMIAIEDLEADLRVGAAMKLVRENAITKKPAAKKAADKEKDGDAVPAEKPAAKKTTAKKTTTTKKTTAKKAAEPKAE